MPMWWPLGVPARTLRTSSINVTVVIRPCMRHDAGDLVGVYVTLQSSRLRLRSGWTGGDGSPPMVS
jgi:hypothetical protein